MKNWMLVSVYNGNSNKISKIKICRLFTHESHFAWFLTEVLLKTSKSLIIYGRAYHLSLYKRYAQDVLIIITTLSLHTPLSFVTLLASDNCPLQIVNILFPLIIKYNHSHIRSYDLASNTPWTFKLLIFNKS